MITKKLFIGLSFILLLLSNLFAQDKDVEFSVTAPNVVAVGEQFRIVYKLNARPQEFNPPSFDNFYILAGPSTSTSSSIQIVNGQMTQTHEFSYTYILEATEAGNFTIDPATATVSKKTHKSEPLSLEVVKGSSSQSSGSQQQQSQQQRQQDSQQKEEEMFVAVEFDRNSAFRGQPILATIKIYTRQNISGFDEVKFPSFNGFWSQEIESPNNVTFQRVNVNGRIYNMGVLKKYLLFPQRTGDIQIEPFELVVLSQQRAGQPQSIFDEFFGSFQTVRKKLASKGTSLKVRALPPNAPESFTGAVGSFNFKAELDKSQVKANEAVNVKLRVAGTGNLKLIETPTVEFPSSFEVFDPKSSERLSVTSKGVTGSRTFEFVAIPRGPGEYNLGELEFSYFDPNQQRYKTIKSNPITITVDADGSEQENNQMVGFGREDIRFIGQDIRFIKTEGVKLTKNASILFASTSYYILIILIIIVFIGLFWWIHQQRKISGNIDLVKIRKANKVAKKRLKLAHHHLTSSDSERFYDELLRALWGYVSDKLSIPIANLSSDSVKTTLENNGVDNVDVEEFLRIIAVCEYARYAPKEEQSQMNELYNSAISLISKLEEVIGK